VRKQPFVAVSCVLNPRAGTLPEGSEAVITSRVT
jgi:hypothetical protein